MKTLLRGVLFAGVIAGVAVPAFAGEVSVKMNEGRVTVIAKDAPLRQILAEWARVGNTRMVNAEKLTGGPLNIQLVDVPENEALEILLRSAAGYMTAPRPQPVAGASVYDRVIILATSRPAPATVSAPQPFNRSPIPQPLPPQPPPEDDDDGEPADQGPNAPPGMQNPGTPFPGPGVQPGVVLPPGAAPAGPMTAPRPGMLPQAQPNVNNPYAPYQPPAVGPNGQPLPAGRGVQRPGQQPGQPPDDDQ